MGMLIEVQRVELLAQNLRRKPDYLPHVYEDTEGGKRFIYPGSAL